MSTGSEPQPVPGLTVQVAKPDDASAIAGLALHFWGETQVECFDDVYDIRALPAYVARLDSELAGALVHSPESDRMLIVLLAVYPQYQGLGIGQRLLEAVCQEAARCGIPQIEVSTTNDDLPALAFYQRHGFRISDVLPGRLLEHHGGEELGFAGIAIRDEIRLLFDLAR